MKIIFSKKCLEYGKGSGHPESSERVEVAYEFLKDKGCEFVEPDIAGEKDILKVHSENLLNQVKQGNFFNADSPVYENIFSYASLSVGGAIKAMEIALKGENAFSLMRPPGHHASDNVEGFCYFNNIAVAVARALEIVDKVAIIDIDVHHGNGTQNIFLKNDKVIYVSLHKKGIYPGTGLVSEKNCYNFPLEEDITEKDYLEKLREGLEKVKEFNPDLVAVSAGFDTYEKDLLVGLGLSKEFYEKIGREINKLGVPVFSVLEGGYSLEIGECVYNYLKGFK